MVAKECVRCHKMIQINVTNEQLIEYIQGDKLIQNVMPQLKPGEREMFISGICDQCWSLIFPLEEEYMEEPFDGRDDEV